uniref:BHLH domain-containing protein n=1 Tax=Podarcis muralis TaxID=64176 RepID=A0A670K7I8_PODMU
MWFFVFCMYFCLFCFFVIFMLYKFVKMPINILFKKKGISPVRSSPAQEEPKNLLYNMDDCYSKLRKLVQRIPQGTKVSQVEILQHFIEYIFDLQIVLEEQTSLLSLKAAERASELCSKEERNLCN